MVNLFSYITNIILTCPSCIGNDCASLSVDNFDPVGSLNERLRLSIWICCCCCWLFRSLRTPLVDWLLKHCTNCATGKFCAGGTSIGCCSCWWWYDEKTDAGAVCAKFIFPAIYDDDGTLCEFAISRTWFDTGDCCCEREFDEWFVILDIVWGVNERFDDNVELKIPYLCWIIFWQTTKMIYEFR